MGGMNYHIEILFEDGISWLARIRRFNATSPPPELRDYILGSEVLTLQFLSKIKVPIPTVFDFNPDDSNPVGVSYILMEKLSGKSLRWSLTTLKQRQKVTSQLADIYIELKGFPFSVIGSFNQQNSSHIGPIARESLADFEDLHMTMLRPYMSSEEYFNAHIQLILDLITR
jgi:aminoglycoside phosphotransferase (APT) family kinase protein